MTRRAITQIVEAFFRRWPIYAALFLGCIGIGAVLVSNTTDEYTSTGSVFVDSQSLVANQSGVRETGGFSFLSPAQFTSQELSGLVSTEVFIQAALERAGAELDSDPILRRSQIDQLRASVGSSANSENLVAVVVTTPDPELSFRVANGVIEEFVQFKIDLDVTESGASERFFADLVDSYEADLTTARSAVESSLRGVSDIQQLTADRQLQVERLQEAEALAEQRYTEALTNLEASRLATLQTETDVRQRYSIFDPPVIPLEPNGGLIDSLIVVLGFAVLGLGLALAGPLFSAALNRTVTFPEDVEAQAGGHQVLAILPRVDKREVRLGGIVVPEDAGTLSGSAVELGQRTMTFVPTGDDDGSEPSVLDEVTEQAAVKPAPSPPGRDAATTRTTGPPSAPAESPAPEPAATSPSPAPEPAAAEEPAASPPPPPVTETTAPTTPAPAPAKKRSEAADEQAAPAPRAPDPNAGQSVPPPPPVPTAVGAAAPPPPVPVASSDDMIESAGVAIVDSTKDNDNGKDDDKTPAGDDASPSNGSSAAASELPDDVQGLLQTTELADHVLPNPPSAWSGGARPAPTPPRGDTSGGDAQKEEHRG